MDEERPDIAAAIERMPMKVGSKKELRKLPELLWENEQVVALLAGAYGKGQGLLVLTDRRIVFTFEGIVSSSSEDFPFAKTSSVQWNSGMLLGTITIFASGNKAEFKNVDKQNGRLFVDLARDRISAPSQAAPRAEAPGAPATEGAPDHMAALKQLGELHDAGVLTDEEFAAKKAEILQRL
ncbi:PH domain-containing protein [Tomitella gaofuii]|uniref:PH domain-containing protein n=1 Tax=Tomitella gaofuii TaxID=2760083 RepID=UPI0015F95498|nr:PH domain-containing protein [Tomitella gaofuii]